MTVTKLLCIVLMKFSNIVIRDCSNLLQCHFESVKSAFLWIISGYFQMNQDAVDKVA